MRLILVYRAKAHVWFAVGLLHLSLGLGWLGERLWHAAKGQMNRAAAITIEAGLARR